VHGCGEIFACRRRQGLPVRASFTNGIPRRQRWILSSLALLAVHFTDGSISSRPVRSAKNGRLTRSIGFSRRRRPGAAEGRCTCATTLRKPRDDEMDPRNLRALGKAVTRLHGTVTSFPFRSNSFPGLCRRRSSLAWGAGSQGQRVYRRSHYRIVFLFSKKKETTPRSLNENR
jgi:hypothetical protein